MANAFGDHLVDLDNSLLTQIWKNQTSKMTEDDFKEIMIEYRDLIIKHEIQKIIVDAQLMNYTIVPELQDWINSEVGSKVLKYNSKLAFVMPSDFFEQISIQQSMDDTKDLSDHQTQYFETTEEAQTWVLS